jgi:hypothetical protein
MGLVYLAINVGLFFLTALVPISSSARMNATDHILTIGVILHQWRLAKPADCDRWIDDAWSLRPLYDAVKKASDQIAKK